MTALYMGDGDRDEPTNYRDICVPNVLAKLLLKRNTHKHTNLVTRISPLILEPNTFEGARHASRIKKNQRPRIQLIRLLEALWLHHGHPSKSLGGCHWQGVISPAQAGFVVMHECEYHIFTLLETVRHRVRQGQDTVLVFLDFKSWTSQSRISLRMGGTTVIPPSFRFVN